MDYTTHYLQTERRTEVISLAFHKVKGHCQRTNEHNNNGRDNDQDQLAPTKLVNVTKLVHVTKLVYKWGKKVFSQPPIVQVLPLKTMREACNFHQRYTSTMTDIMKKTYILKDWENVIWSDETKNITFW